MNMTGKYKWTSLYSSLIAQHNAGKIDDKRFNGDMVNLLSDEKAELEEQEEAIQKKITAIETRIAQHEEQLSEAE